MTIELSELRDSANKAFPADRLAPDRDESWQLVTDMGWLMLELPEELGGLGLGPEASATIHFEFGKSLPSAPLLPALLAVKAVFASDRLAGQDAWIERLCGGEYVPLNLLTGEVKLDGRVLSGRIPGFLEADLASHVLAGMPDNFQLIPLDAPGVSLVEHSMWDPGRRMFELVLEGFRLDPELTVAVEEDAARLHQRLSAAAQLGLAADSLGAAGTLFELTLDYLKTRKQFGRPLAMFQALKHRVADLKIRLEAAEALLWNRAGGNSSLNELGSLRAHCVQVFRDVAEEAIQLHGGIGLTEEHPCHLFLKRAMLNAVLAGDCDHWEGVAGRAALAGYE